MLVLTLEKLIIEDDVDMGVELEESLEANVNELGTMEIFT